jgi:glycosyltransferase involved in cell wall biosynthesis
VFVLAGGAQGRERYRAEIEDLIAARGLKGRVRLVGHVDDMPAAFLVARLAVVASTEPEAFGRTATEAQSMGCPVIVTDHGAPPETVLTPPRVRTQKRTGWVVPPGEARALAAAIAEARALTGEERVEMGRRARAHVLSTYGLDSMRRATLAVYDQLLGTSLGDRYHAELRAPVRPGPQNT